MILLDSDTVTLFANGHARIDSSRHDRRGQP